MQNGAAFVTLQRRGQTGHQLLHQTRSFGWIRSGGRQQPSKWSPRPSPWSSGLQQPAAASCSLGFSMTQFCVKSSLVAVSDSWWHIFVSTLNWRLQLLDSWGWHIFVSTQNQRLLLLEGWRIFASSWIRVCNSQLKIGCWRYLFCFLVPGFEQV